MSAHRLTRAAVLWTALELGPAPLVALGSEGTPASWTRMAADPAHAVLSVQNVGDAGVEIEWVALNSRAVFGSVAEIQDEIDAIPPEADGSEATRVFRFVTANRVHGFPLTTLFQWLLTPTLFFNSPGVGLCGEAAEEVNMLATDRGMVAREWGLNGHVVAEVNVGGRWQMYDADYGVYFLNHQGQIASVAELASDSSLITSPVMRLETTGLWSPYHPVYAALFATTADNFIRRNVPRATMPPRPLSVSLPRGASLRFPGRFAAAPPDYLGGPVEDYANLVQRLPAGSSGSIANPFLLHTIRGSGVVSLDGQVFAIGSTALRDAIDARTSPLEQTELLQAATAVEMIYLVNPMRWMLGSVNTLELLTSAGAPLAVEVKATGDPEGESDLDGVADDGDGTGIVGDAPCADGQTSGCDDNCVVASNASQLDADGDGAGNACDGDFDQDELITDADRAVLEACVAGAAPLEDPDCLESDLNEDGSVDAEDRVAFDPASTSCGLGPELGLTLVLLGAARRRRRPWSELPC